MSDPSDLPQPCWLTRDCDEHGVLSDQVEVWTRRPELDRLPGGGTMWIGQGATGLSDRWAAITVAQAENLVSSGAVPMTYLEVIVVGDPSVIA